MKSSNSQNRIFKFSLMSWTLAVLALTFATAISASATVPLFQNTSVLNFVVPGTPPPTIDASNFVNLNQFNINFEEGSVNAQFYQPMNTVNYTNASSGINTGLMTVGSPIITSGFLITSFDSVGAGFRFDTQTTNTIPHQEAGTFYNAGTIRCDSVLDGNNVLTFSGAQFFTLLDVGQCRVWATNIFCPGNIDASEDGFIQLTGENVDLRRSVLTLEQGLANSNSVNATVNSMGEGFNTNGYAPFFALTATNASSSLPDNLILSFPTSYFETPPVKTGPSNFLVRSVFLVNVNPNVSANVYIAPAAFDNEGALIQWSGSFLNPATGIVNTNYLYLFHYYPGSFGLTNLFPVLSVGTPAVPGFINAFNYLWSQPAPLGGLGNPNTPGFQNNIFPNILLTNNVYEFFNASLTATTTGTNASPTNPSGALTNLPARIQITANNDLKMDLAQISGQNYLSITATNQFDGSPGAQIYSPFSDINLGVTNGYPHPLTISNLLASSITAWGGTVDEWSTRFTNTDSSGNTTDFRVLLVFSDLTPATTPQVQNLTLTASNLVISDLLNISGKVSANATSLTLTTNFFGSGATSPDGELNMTLSNPLAFNWTNSFPNLLFLTNSGAIRTPNWINFVGTGSMTNSVATIPPIQAAATLSQTGPSTNNITGGTVTIGGTTYVFTNKLNNTIAFQVKLGTNFNGSVSNLIAAINRGSGAGTNYSTNTPASSVAMAGLLNTVSHSVVISANSVNYPGHLGNGIPVSTTVTNLAWNSTILTGGVDGILGTTNLIGTNAPYGAIVNNGFIGNLGTTIWVTNFVNGGAISNGPGSFQLNAITAAITNGSITAGGDISLTANTIVVSNVMLQAGRSLALQGTNLLTDGGVSNTTVWAVGATNGTGGNGLMLPFLPVAANAPPFNDLLGTTISLVTPPPNKEVSSEWAGLDFGVSTMGFANNEAIGQLILTSLSPNSTLSFSGPAGSTNNNAIYVDRLVLENYASLADKEGTFGIPTLVFNSNPNAGNLIIYYADAVSSSTVNGGPLLEVSSLLNGLNGGHLVWVPQFTGIFSGVSVRYSNGSTYRLNAGLVNNTFLTSAGTTLANANNPNPIFVDSQINFHSLGVVNGSNALTWSSPPGATNFLLNCTTNFANWNNLTIMTNAPTLLPPSQWPITNIVYEPANPNSGSYRVKIIQDNSILYGQ